MKINFHKSFEKQFKKLQKSDQVRVIKALELFAKDPFADKLRNHPLKGEFLGFSSISAGGDLRLHYYEKEENVVVVFVHVGSHSQLYK